MSSLTRRTFLAVATATLGAGAAAVACRRAGPDDRSAPGGDEDDEGDDGHDVAVVGAGLAGLTAARQMVADGLDVVVFEARDRVGGRTLTQAVIDGSAVEAGGMWVGPGQDAVLGVAEELGVGMVATPVGGDVVAMLGGEVIRLPAGRDRAAEAVFDTIDAMARTVPPDRPWDAPNATVLDTMTVAEWLATEAVPDDLALTVAVDVGVALGPPESISMLWFLTVVASAGGFRRLVDVAGGAQERRVGGGAQSLSTALAAALGDRVRLSSPVEVIELDDGRAHVRTATGVVAARRVVVAMMPADAARVRFVPPLPDDRARLQDSWVGTTGIKATVGYPRPFWRDDGLSGAGFVDDGTVAAVMDISPPGQERGVLVAFAEGDLIDEEGFRRAALADLVGLFGDEAASPDSFHAFDWGAEAWTAGCVSALPPGLLTGPGRALREPVGVVHWAGTETAAVWTGYMDGAVRSGERAAAEVRDALR